MRGHNVIACLLKAKSCLVAREFRGNYKASSNSSISISAPVAEVLTYIIFHGSLRRRKGLFVIVRPIRRAGNCADLTVMVPRRQKSTTSSSRPPAAKMRLSDECTADVVCSTKKKKSSGGLTVGVLESSMPLKNVLVLNFFLNLNLKQNNGIHLLKQ